MVNIFNIPMKTTINRTMKSKSIMVVGKSKAGKTTLAAQAPRPIFLLTENGVEAVTGITPVPIASWPEFRSAVNQLCSEQGRSTWDTVVIDTYTNLILLLDKYIGSKMTTEKQALDFGSDADYGKGTKGMRNELGSQLQRLANQGYLLMNIVHAEDKVDFQTQKAYVGTSLSNSLYGVAEKFVDQIIYVRRDEDRKGNIEHRIWFTPKGGFSGTGGRFTPKEESVPCSYENLEKAILGAIDEKGKNGIELTTDAGPAVIIENTVNFEEEMDKFETMTNRLMDEDPENGKKIVLIVEEILGPGKKVSNLTSSQADLLAEINDSLKKSFEFNLN